MPAVGNAQVFQKPPPKPAPAPKPLPTSGRTANNPRGVAITPPRPQPVPRALTTTANPRGVAIVQPSHGPTVNDVHATHPDPKATISVFRAQPLAQQQAVVRGALRNPSVPASKIVLDYLKGAGAMQVPGASALLPSPNVLSGIANALSPESVYGAPKAGQKGGGSLAGVAMFGGAAGGKQLLANAGKDIVGLPAAAFSSVAVPVGDVLAGKPGKALSDIASPFVQLAEHPAQSFYQHPVNTYLMATGALHGATRLAAAPVRALAPRSAAARALSTSREGVALSANLTHERPPYSLSPTVKAQQVALEKLLYTRAPTRELVPRSEHLFKHQLNQGVGQLVGVRERIRAVNRNAAVTAREKSVAPNVAVKAAHGAKTALAYNPKGAAIPGAGVLARIADATIRRPDTIKQDIATHLRQVSANRPNLLDDKAALKAHDAYVKQLTAALNNKAFLKNPGRAFKAAEAYKTDYAPVEAKAAALGHFRDMSSEALQRRALMHYGSTHMEGVRYNNTLGLVRDAAKPEVRSFRSGLIAQANKLESKGAVQKAAALREQSKEAWREQAVPVSNAEILAHLNGKNGTGGRLPTYTPDVVRFNAAKTTRAARYVSGERRPLPTSKANTLYAYTHGLTNPGHEALTNQHALMQGIVDAHNAQNAYADTLHVQMPGGGYAKTYAEAEQRLRNTGLKPINLAQPFHPQASLDQALEGVNPGSAEMEILRHSLDLSSKMQPGAGEGRWAGIDPHALQVLREHQGQISPGAFMRSVRGLNNTFRSVVLSTSAKHVPGVAQENIIRDIAHGVGFRSWVTGRKMAAGLKQTEEGRNVHTGVTGGQVAGMTQAGKTYLVSDHYAGTSVHPFLKAFETAAKTPGTRQITGMWKAWSKLVIGGTKHVLEQQHQIAGMGKAALREHGYAEAARTQGFMGLMQRTMGLHGQMLEDATRGLFDPAKARQLRAGVNQMYGKWTDLSPSAQTALMFSPFGLWWVNSAKFIARMPVDMPVKTALLASATVGTQPERQAQGLDMFGPNALPGYEQGGIPAGGKILAQNYYSPFGVANEPLATGASLIQPWALPLLQGAGGVNWLWKPLSSPGNPHGNKPAGLLQKAQYILDSAASSFLPLYMKAKQVAEGGASPFDVSGDQLLPPLLRGKSPPTKTAGAGALAGLRKAAQPYRTYKIASGSTGGPVIPGSGSVGGAVIPGSGSLTGAVIP